MSVCLFELLLKCRKRFVGGLVVGVEGEKRLKLETGLTPLLFSEEKLGQVGVGQHVIGVKTHGIVKMMSGPI